MAAALLRSGKFLRMVTGLTRQQINQQPLPGSHPSEGGGTACALPPASGGFESQFQAWSLQNFQGILPALGAATVSNDDDVCQAQKPTAGILELLTKDQPKAEGVLGPEAKTESKPIDVKPRNERALKWRTKKDEEGLLSSSAPSAICPPETKVEEGKVEELQTKPDRTKQPEPERKAELGAVKASHEGEVPSQVRTEVEVQQFLPQMVPVVPMVDANQGHAQWYPLPVVCQMFREQGRYWDLEGLLEGSRGIRPEDRKVVFFWTLQAYADAGLFDRAAALSGQLYLEGLGQHFSEFHQLMSSFAAAHGAFASCSSYALPSGISSEQESVASLTPTDVSLFSSPRDSPVPKKPGRRNSSKSVESKVHVQRKFKKALSEKNVAECLSAYREMSRKSLSATEVSSFIEMLVRAEMVKEATEVTEKMLSNDVYPMPKIFRFLLNRLASTGDVDSMLALGGYLTSRVKKDVSFDNRLCNAYLAAGRGAEYLDALLKELNAAIESKDFSQATIQTLKDKFPRGGAMGLLEANPHLVESYTDLAHKFLELGYVAPMNVLWTYHFICGKHDVANALWEKYVKSCPQIMFQKVCQTARATSNADLAQRLVNLLENASTVTVGARGIAYSCLLDVLTQRKEYSEGVKALRRGLESGINIEDVNRTALKRLKEGLESTSNEKFPFQIPKKSNSSKPHASRGSEGPSTEDIESSAEESSESTAVVAVN